jgi:hypothetical protein
MESLTPTSSNIQVYLRFRPLSLQEALASEESIWRVADSTVSLSPDCHTFLSDTKKAQACQKTFTFSNS